MKITTIEGLAISEEELITYGCEKGSFVKHVLNSMLREVNNGRTKNTKDDLLQLLTDMY